MSKKNNTDIGNSKGKEEFREGSENKLGRIFAIVGGSILGALVLFLLLCIFGVKSSFNFAGYQMHAVEDASSSVLPNGSIYISCDTPRDGGIAAGEAIIFIDEAGIDQLGRITGVSQENGEAITYTVTLAKAGAEPQTIDAIAVTDIVSLYIPWVGYAVSFIVTPLGLICCVAIPLLILLVVEIINLIRLPKSLAREEREAGEAQLDRRIGTEPQERDGIESDIEFDRSDTISSQLIRAAIQTDEAEPAVISGLAGSMIENLGDSVELIGGKTEKRNLEYDKPKLVVPVPQAAGRGALGSTQEFRLPLIRAGKKPAASTAAASIATASLTDIAKDAAGSFSADLREEEPNHFCIDGISVHVEPDNIRLSVSEEAKNRDISITVTKDFTNVIVGAKESEIDFALFRDEKDDEQKVIIRKKSK